MRCPCVGRNRRQLLRWTTKVRERPVPAATAYSLFSLLSQSKAVTAWRDTHDPGADDWRWKMSRAHLKESYAGPEPRALDAFPPPVGMSAIAAARLANEIAGELQRKGYYSKLASARATRAINEFLKKRREKYVEAFVIWLMNEPALYDIVVDESHVERTPLIIRTGPESSETHVIENPLPTYEVHWKGRGPAGDRPPEPWELLQVSLTRDLQKEANDNLRKRPPDGSKAASKG